MVGDQMRDGSTDFETGWLFDGNYERQAVHLERAIAGLGHMRDGSVDYNTGWLFDGNYLTRPLDLSKAIAGLAGLGADAATEIAALPKVGQVQVAAALKDPVTAPIVRQLLRNANPDNALALQAAADVEEMAHPTGKIIVFKNVAAKVGPQLKTAENAVMAALPNKNTEEASVARQIIANSSNPERDLGLFYKSLALDAVGITPEEVGEADFWTSEEQEIFGGLGALGKPKWLKKVQKVIKSVAKPLAIAAAVIVAAPIAIAAVGAVGSAVVGGAKALFGVGSAVAGKIFGGGAAAAPVSTDQASAEQFAANEKAQMDAQYAAQAQSDADRYAAATGGSGLIPGATAQATSSPGIQIPWGKIADLGVKVVKYKQAQAKAKAAQRDADATANAQQAQYAHEEAIQSLVNQGIPRQQAEQYVQQAEQQAQAQMPAPPAQDQGQPPPGAPTGSSKVVEAGFPVLPAIIVAGVVLIALGGKGGGSRTRRNPRPYYRSQRRRRSA